MYSVIYNKGYATGADPTGHQVSPWATTVTRHWRLHRLCSRLMGGTDGASGQLV